MIYKNFYKYELIFKDVKLNSNLWLQILLFANVRFLPVWIIVSIYFLWIEVFIFTNCYMKINFHSYFLSMKCFSIHILPTLKKFYRFYHWSLVFQQKYFDCISVTLEISKSRFIKNVETSFIKFYHKHKYTISDSRIGWFLDINNTHSITNSNLFNINSTYIFFLLFYC